MDNLRKIAENFNTITGFTGTVRFDEPMSMHTTFQIGGPAAVFVEPDDIVSLEKICLYLKEQSVPFFVLGGGSNLVAPDEGLNRVVVSTEKISFISAEQKADREKGSDGKYVLHCGAGTAIKSLTQYCIDNEFSGMESFAGLPGTVGGALFMNARCYGTSVSDVLCSAAYLIPQESNTVMNYEYLASDWDYKKSPFQTGGKIVLSADFLVKKGNKSEIAAACRVHEEDRRSKGHFTYPSAGSVFKNNRAFGKPSGQIIDEAGLRGMQIGGAQVSSWHGNFIINTGTATAADVRLLVEQIIVTVKQKTGFVLEPEVIFL